MRIICGGHIAVGVYLVSMTEKNEEDATDEDDQADAHGDSDED